MISVTMLSGYMYCPRKLYIQYVLKIVPPPKQVMVKGTIRHKVYELLNEKEEQLVSNFKEKDAELILGTYRGAIGAMLRKSILMSKYQMDKLGMDKMQVYKQIIPFFEKEANARANNIIEFMEKTGLTGSALWSALIPKIISEVKVQSYTLGLRGIIDRVEDHIQHVVPVELKTGKAPKEGAWPVHILQLGAYILLAREKYKIDIKEGFIHYLDHDIKRKVTMNPFFEDEIKQTIGKVESLLKTKKPPKVCNQENKCRICDLYEQCQALNNNTKN